MPLRLQAVPTRRRFLSGASNQISLMKWTYDTKPIGSEMKGIHALHFLTLPSMAMSPWNFDHFISEITDCTQQTKTAALWEPPAAEAASPLMEHENGFLLMAL